MDWVGGALALGIPLALIGAERVLRNRALRRYLRARHAEVQPIWIVVLDQRIDERVWPAVTPLTLEGYHEAYLDAREAMRKLQVRSIDDAARHPREFLEACEAAAGAKSFSYRIPHPMGEWHVSARLEAATVQRLVALNLVPMGPKDTPIDDQRWVVTVACGASAPLFQSTASAAAQKITWDPITGHRVSLRPERAEPVAER